MLAYIGHEDLKHEVEEMTKNHELHKSSLKMNLDGRDPDEGVSAIAYDKGYLFLRKLESIVGREKWDKFINEYFSTQAFKTINSVKFIDYLKNNLPEAVEKVDLEEWIYGKGIPADAPDISSPKFKEVEQKIQLYMNGAKTSELETEKWAYQQWVHFLTSLPQELTIAQLSELDKAFNLTQQGNNEILCQWLKLVVRYEYEAAFPKVKEFLVNVGRRKFLTPIYGEMLKSEKMKKFALDIYKEARPNYHFVAYNTLDEMLGLK